MNRHFAHPSKWGFLIVLLGVLTFVPARGGQAGRPGFAGRIAFLRSGEIWVADQDGGDPRRVTDTAGKVEDFLFSPSLDYMAYSRRIRTVDEPGLWDDGETPPQRSVCSIVILELEGLTPKRELTPPEGEWIYPDKWIPQGRLFGHRASGFDVSGFFVFDAVGGRQIELDYPQGGLLLEADFTADGSLQTYVKDSGVGKDFSVGLYLVDLKTRAEKFLLSKRSVLAPKISPEKTRIAFFEVSYEEKKGFDTLWIYDIRKDLLEIVYRGPAKPKTGGVSDLAWSPDGRHLAVSFPSETRVLDIEDPAHILRVPGTDLSWVSGRQAVFSRENRVYSYQLDAGKSDLLIENASKPVFLARPTL